MHEINIQTVQNETLKLIQITQNLLKDLNSTANINSDKATLSKKNLDTYIDALNNGAQKVKNLEFVITVVGTMKAGKSTTINAIVGQEVLPNRSFPMTALPTLVTHKQGQSEPLLTLPKREPLIKLLKNIKEVISNKDNGEFLGSKDGKEIKTLIEKNKINFQDEYKGQYEIFNFLKVLNDLMRTAKELEIEPPYEEFIEVNDLPRIEVEFYHLKHMENISESRLSILDTPGPNEFKHSKQLQEVFRKQMHLASAIMLVMDYTIMNSKSDNEVREQVKEIINLIGEERMFVLVNKFDEKGKNDSSYDETKEHIAKYLLNEQVPLENIYPVSSKLAFWVNRGLSEIEKNSSINMDLDWVEDFGQEIIGRRWQKTIEDTEEVIEICKDVWTEYSYFERPLNNIIVHAHSKSAIGSISVALGKLLELSNQLDNALKTKKNALTENIQKLKSNINSLEKDISNMSEISQKIDKDIDNSLKSINETMSSLMVEKINELQEEVLMLFRIKEEAVEKSKLEESEKQDTLNKKTRVTLFDLIFGKKSKGKKINKNFNDLIRNGEIEFYSNSEAKEFTSEIHNLLEKSILSTLNDSEKELQNEIKEFLPKINKIIKTNLGELLDTIQERIGVDLAISTPEVEFNKEGISVKKEFSRIVNKKTEERSRSVVTNGFTNFFNDDWGRETEYYDVTTYRVKKENIERKLNTIFKKTSDLIIENIESIYSNDIKKTISESIKNLITEIEGYRGEMLEVLSDRESQRVNIQEELLLIEEKEELLHNNIKRLKKSSEIIEKMDNENE